LIIDESHDPIQIQILILKTKRESKNIKKEKEKKEAPNWALTSFRPTLPFPRMRARPTIPLLRWQPILFPACAVSSRPGPLLIHTPRTVTYTWDQDVGPRANGFTELRAGVCTIRPGVRAHASATHFPDSRMH
jgi:hypothetical protein